ncbi:MAG: SLOG family protein, partial [Bacteroidota bacterium]
MNKISVISNPDFQDYNLLKLELQKEKIDVIVVGGRGGADLLAEEYAIEQEVTLQVFLPDYRQYGEEAYLYRNELIIQNSTKIIIFWNRISKVPI